MVDPSVPLSLLGERPADDGTASVLLCGFADTAASTGRAASGHHNRNYVLPVTPAVAPLLRRPPGTPVTVRVPRSDAPSVVIRTWHDEAAVLRAVHAALPHTPECLAEQPGFAVHSYVEGAPLSALCPGDKPVDSLLVQELAGLLAGTALVPPETLPPLPDDWPADHTDSRGFLRTLAGLADRQVRRANEADFGGLFADLGIPAGALLSFAENLPALTRRPYGLLHGDLHRDNLIVSYAGDPPLVCLDWELATYGDPLHDLATHLVRMRYPDHQRPEVIEAWARAMGEVRPAAVDGLDRDLRHYLAFEHAQSVYPDIMRTARSLETSPTRRRLDEATVEVRRALLTAQRPLRLRVLPPAGEIEQALLRWLAARGHDPAGIVGAGRDRVPAWRPDERLPGTPGFRREHVEEVLAAEAVAPAHRVFEGSAHRNVVVQPSNGRPPVVVRRRLPGAPRRERSYLSEHAVLRAIEASKIPVSAPRALALGTSHGDDHFAVHTYVGTHPDQPPVHPVRGLRPREADGLVDQLCALTEVDYRHLDPTAGEGRFHTWLTEQLVLLVRHLSPQTGQLARGLGLPGPRVLRQVLLRHRVTERTPTLLHGDLNPWNLVCRPDRLGVTLIDWEMAVVGDPLYDLVRHLHLTPTRPEIRERLFRRWEARMPPQHTVNWREDWRVYRWLELIRSAYLDLDRLVTGAGLDAPNVRRAVDSYAGTLTAATAALGRPLPAPANPYLLRALT
ncbi:phosphotransferase enzyme family protein [Streptomyces longwoodensis]|uniref:Phosphotransferase enzyme family protein n=1 Tax=Streptomyces longwoodensis TaxID=68231 RepID=A0A101QWX5_9ACTN|nr:phosphotransferase enzyme family protein [Streptomyces longwoodensis]